MLVAEQLLELFRVASDADMDIANYNDNTHECILSIINQLLDRGEIEAVNPLLKS